MGSDDYIKHVLPYQNKFEMFYLSYKYTSIRGVCLKDGNPNTKALADDITDYDCLDGGVGHYIFDHILNNKDVEF